MADGVTLALSRMNRVLELDWQNRLAVVQPGVTNLAITRAAERYGLYYAPDPSSQIACSIGGNVAENSGGVHCLKYGVTTNNLLGLEVVLADGEILRFGGKTFESAGYDILGLLSGSEGLLGVITEVTVKLLPKPETAQALLATFDSVEAAGDAVAAIIAAGMIPAGMEMMDALAIQASEDYAHAGYPLDAEALLLIEHDGPQDEVEERMQRTVTLLNESQACLVRLAASEAERQAFWAGRKAAFPAMGRISPDYYCIDGTIPRRLWRGCCGALPSCLERAGYAWPTCFTPAMAICIPWCSTMPMCPANSSVPSVLGRRSSSCASMSGGCSRVSTGLGWKSVS